MPYSFSSNSFPGPMREIVDEYAKLNDVYEERSGDAAHWYAESTCASLFSVAAWRCGNEAICAVPCRKKVNLEERDNPQPDNGKIDILVRASNDLELWIEAKRPHEVFDVSENSENPASQAKLSRCFWAAYESAFQNKRAAKDYGGKIVSIVFCSFSLKADYYAGPEAVEKRQLRAKHVNSVLSRIAAEDPASSFFASYFDLSEKLICDELGNRPFGFAILGHFEDS